MVSREQCKSAFNCTSGIHTPPQRWRLLRKDGAGFGTRHAAAVGVTEWLGSRDMRGVVFVRSDDGGIHALLSAEESEHPRAFRIGKDEGCTLVEEEEKEKQEQAKNQSEEASSAVCLLL